jgi:hypothetical protein
VELRASVWKIVSFLVVAAQCASPGTARAWDDGCPLLLAYQIPEPAFLASFRQRVAQKRIEGKLEDVDFGLVRQFEARFKADPGLAPNMGLFEEDIAYINVQNLRATNGAQDLTAIFEGNDWLKKRRLYKALAGVRPQKRASPIAIRRAFEEIRLLREGSEVSVLDWFLPGRSGKLERSLRTVIDREVAIAGLKRTLTDFGLLSADTSVGKLRRFLTDPNTQFAVNLVMNVYSIFPIYGTLVGRLPHIPWFKAGDEEILDFLINGISDEKWATYNAKHAGVYEKDRFYAALSAVVVMVSTTALGVVYVKKRNAEEAQLETDSGKIVAENARKADALTAQARVEKSTSAFDDAMAAWVWDYAAEHHGMPADTSAAEYQTIRAAFKKAFKH